MEYITLKNSNLQVSRLCMGGCPMGGYGWGKVEEKGLLAAIGSAMEHGVNFFDTADTYGLGQSERTLAKGLGPHRKDVVIETKFGVRAGGGKTVYDNSPAYIQTALEASLRRLNTDYIDIYLIHYRDGKTPIAEVTGKLEQLKAQGKIRITAYPTSTQTGWQKCFPMPGNSSAAKTSSPWPAGKTRMTCRRCKTVWISPP